MPQCVSVKNRTSTDKCTSEAMKGHTLCGRHVRAKNPRLWADVNRERVNRFTKVQALFRGWCVRKVLKLAGPGVLSRKDCTNDEDLGTMESKDRQYPLDYFGIEESGKIWWWDFGTIWEWIIRSVTPTNPYTKVAFAHSDLARLRKLHLYRRRCKLPVPMTSKDLRENITRRWNVLTHIFRSFGFEDIHPEQYANLTQANLRTMFRVLVADLNSMPKPNHRTIVFCAKAMMVDSKSNSGYTINALNMLTILLTDTQAYDIVFLIVSALYRC